MSYQRKAGNYFFPGLLVRLLPYFEEIKGGL
jgi:hypothetical protein